MKISMYGYALELNNNELTGKTFDLKTNLKTWGCTYNPTNKSWILPEKYKAEFIAKFAVVEAKPTTTNKATTICPKCGTYCYGDCSVK